LRSFAQKFSFGTPPANVLLPFEQVSIAHRGRSKSPGQSKEKVMLYWALMFLVVALIAAALGFTGVAGTSAWIAQVLFVVFLVLFVISLLTGGLRRPVP
jgi:uncharacterized membrane protein YtjA (UPF0391 family)